MPNNYGLSFQPGTEQGSGEQQQGPGPTPIQSAVKLLSLRLPSVVGAQAISPQALLESPGSAGVGGPGGMGGDALIEWLRKLLTQSGAQTPPQAQQNQSPMFQMPGNIAPSPSMNRGGNGGVTPAPSAPPPPRVIPGETPDAPLPEIDMGATPQSGRQDVTPSAGVPSPFDVDIPDAPRRTGSAKVRRPMPDEF